MRPKSFIVAPVLTAAFLLLALAGPALAGPGADAEILAVKANLALKEGNWDEAIRLADEALAQNAGRADALAVKGQAQMEKGEIEEALRTFERVEAMRPEEESWRVGYGIVLLKAEKNKKALVQLGKAVGADPSNGTAHYYLGYAQYVSGQYRDAIASLSRAIDAGQNLHRSHYYRGRSQYLMLEAGAAKADFEACLEANAEGPLAEKAREGLALLGDVEAEPMDSAEAEQLKLRGRLGLAYDSNVTVTPDASPSEAVGGNQKDLRLEVELGVQYESDPQRSTQFGAGYQFMGFFELGVPHDATTDFTIMSHTASLFAAHSYNSEDSVALSGDYILTTLGRLSEEPGSTGSRLGHGIYSHQAIASLAYFRNLSEHYTLGAYGRYAREFFPDDNPVAVAAGLVTPVISLDNSYRDADIVDFGVRSITNLQGSLGRDGTLAGVLSFYWRMNEHDPSDAGSTATEYVLAQSDAASYLGPRVRLNFETPVSEFDEALVLGVRLFYGYEFHYDDETFNADPDGDATVGPALGVSHRKDHRFFGILSCLYNLDENLGVEAAYRGELLRSNLPAGPFDPSYTRHVGTLSVIFKN